LNLKNLEWACNATPEELTTGFQTENNYWFKDNGADILAVAHLDSIQKGTSFGFLKFSKETRVYSPRLDDRLGVYIILFLLPEMGINVDILFTTDEEIMQSSAKNFKTTKEYKWIVEFDRTGGDVVLYHFETKKISDALKSVGFKIGIGSYTDICDLDLGVVGFNVGVGYYDCHQEFAYFIQEILSSQLDKFKSFYQKYKDTTFPFKKFDGLSIDHKWQDLNSIRCENCWAYCDSYGFCSSCVTDRLEVCDGCFETFDSYDLIDEEGEVYCELCYFGENPVGRSFLLDETLSEKSQNRNGGRD
jgi:hypothetical protein